MKAKNCMKILHPLVDHLHDKHNFHSSVIAEPFIFISCSLLHVARPLCSRIYHVRGKEGFDLRKVYDSFSRTWEYRSVLDKIRFAKASSIGWESFMHILYIIFYAYMYNSSFNIEILLRQPHVSTFAFSYYLSSRWFPQTNRSFFHVNEYFTRLDD